MCHRLYRSQDLTSPVSTPYASVKGHFKVASHLLRNRADPSSSPPHSSHSHHKSVHKYYNYIADKLAFERQTCTSLWDALDAVLTPVQAIPALPHGGCDRLTLLACATPMCNVVDSPVGVVPVTRVDPVRDELSDEWRGARERHSFLHLAHRYILATSPCIDRAEVHQGIWGVLDPQVKISSPCITAYGISFTPLPLFSKTPKRRRQRQLATKILRVKMHRTHSKPQTASLPGNGLLIL
jgi:hypothetical protein